MIGCEDLGIPVLPMLPPSPKKLYFRQLTIIYTLLVKEV
ncbi:hypothetical protein DSOL_3715 [Desulfosporosinus metallidurans]|uniref:Uncharacterized protein n=1 Tax=Desulfosporosinus metallidurans TaxID=1888891 RepID=A0A1Q8QNZ7_9FIRM|nr:hypothetical protein DSOL_3715 [Desulfosporosinus metallidurans]